MADILQFELKPVGRYRDRATVLGEVVLFPGVRVERLDPATLGAAIAGATDLMAAEHG
ncbi:MAG: hypothetical protein U1E46_01845 [Hyphomicrobiales bacterium]